ncbi:MAG TPA: 4-hydroxybenzoate octaprenyltransferase [Woeseiaceae bacterium]|nr:4-hydroxybenzoate octaprenyltransferase [Woeseiaceae bacterium]|tara:strand:+ start:5358 stop:6221 length:864 start_codon:yes stop_codon:yes gene_type:complete
MKNKTSIKDYLFLMRLDKPIGILLLMWPMLWSIWIASKGQIELDILIIFLIGVIVMRSAGCVLNDFADRKIDPHVKRTRDRPIASGKISANQAMYLFLFLMVIALSLIYFLNNAAKLLAFFGAGITIIYPFIKRILSVPQLILGVAFGWAIPMAFAAHLGHVPFVGWLIFGIAILWALIYDTFYAMVDRDDDLNLNIKSTAILFGNYDLIFIGIFQALMVCFLCYMSYLEKFDIWVNLSIIVSIMLMIYHQWLARNRDRNGCFKAFNHNHYIGMIIFIGIILHYHGP